MPALLPISVAGFRRDVPPRSDRNEPSSPFICQLLCYFDWAVRIICAGNNQCGIRQRKLWNLSERWSRKLFSFEVRRRHEERPCNREVRTMLARPADAQKTSQAMGYENRRSCTRFHNSVQRRHPVVKLRSVPTRRLQPQCICFAFLPEGLPMLGAGVVETGKNQKRDTHYFSLRCTTLANWIVASPQ